MDAGYLTGQEVLNDLVDLFGKDAIRKALDDRRWISVNERLPESKTGFVMIHVDFHEPHTKAAIRLGWYDESDGLWRTQIGRLRRQWEVTHWMPLPEPPETER